MKKEELDKPVTKGEFHLAVNEFHLAVNEFRLAMSGLNKRMDGFQTALVGLKNYVDNRFEEFEKIVYTKADHAVFMTWMDEAMKELRDAREGRVLTERQVLRLDDKVADHESRICVLEKK